MFDFWLYSYVGGFFGSVSFGYFLLRFGMPDIRALPRQIKLGLSGFAGILIFLISAVISYFFLTPMFLYVLMPSLTFVALMAITFKNHFFAPKTLKVAVPVVKIRNASKIRKEVKQKPKQALEKLVKQVEEEELKKPEVEEEKQIKASGGVEIKVQQPQKLEVMPEKKEEPKAHVGRESPYARHRASSSMVEDEKKEAGIRSTPVSSSTHHELSRREKYLKRRGLLVEQVKADLTKPKELKGESAPLPIIPEEDVQLEFGEGLDLSDLESVDSLSELGGLEDLGDDSLSGLSDLDESTLDNLGGLSVEHEIKKEKGMSCPTCGAKNAKIIYCPYCGKGFCSNCSLKVQRKGDLVIYQCPNCKKEVIVKSQ